MNPKHPVLRPVHHTAARLLAQGVRPEEVASRFGFDPASLETARRLAASVRAPVVPPREISGGTDRPDDIEELPAPKRQSGRPTGQVVADSTLLDLLAWSDREGDQRARSLAVRIRGLAGDLAIVRERYSPEGLFRRADEAEQRRVERVGARLAAMAHGSKQSCAAHHSIGDPLCGACAGWAARHARGPGAGNRCGTRAGMQAHYDHGEPVCGECRAADRAVHGKDGPR